MSSASSADARLPGRARRRLVGLARLSVAAAILGYLAHQVSIPELISGFSSAAPAPLLGAFGLALATQTLVAERVRRLLLAQGLALSTLEVFKINLATMFYALFLPAGNVTGIIVRYFGLARRERVHLGIALALVFDRIVATITLCLVGLAFWLLAAAFDLWPAMILMAGSLVALLLLCTVLFTGAALPGARPAIRFLAHRYPGAFAAFDGALRRSRGMAGGTLAWVFALGMLGHVLGVFGYAAIAHGLTLDISWLTLGWMRSAALLMAILPISAGGLGVREGTLVVLLTADGVDLAGALAFSLLVFALTILGVGLLGGLIEARRLLWHGALPR